MKTFPFLCNENNVTPKKAPSNASTVVLLIASFNMKYDKIATMSGCILVIKVALLDGTYFSPMKKQGMPMPPIMHLKSIRNLYPGFTSNISIF